MFEELQSGMEWELYCYPRSQRLQCGTHREIGAPTGCGCHSGVATNVYVDYIMKFAFVQQITGEMPSAIIIGIGERLELFSHSSLSTVAECAHSP